MQTMEAKLNSVRKVWRKETSAQSEVVSMNVFDSNGNSLLRCGDLKVPEKDASTIVSLLKSPQRTMFSAYVLDTNYVCMVNNTGCLIGRGGFNTNFERSQSVGSEKVGKNGQTGEHGQDNKGKRDTKLDAEENDTNNNSDKHLDDDNDDCDNDGGIDNDGYDDEDNDDKNDNLDNIDGYDDDAGNDDINGENDDNDVDVDDYDKMNKMKSSSDRLEAFKNKTFKENNKKHIVKHNIDFHKNVTMTTKYRSETRETPVNVISACTVSDLVVVVHGVSRDQKSILGLLQDIVCLLSDVGNKQMK